MLGWAKVSLQLRLLELQREKTGKAILSVEPVGGQVMRPVLQHQSSLTRQAWMLLQSCLVLRLEAGS